MRAALQLRLRLCQACSSSVWLRRAGPRLYCPRASVVTLSASASASPRLAVGFSAGGLLFPYYIGVRDTLRAARVVDDTTPWAGASAGSLMSAAECAGLDTHTLLDALSVMASDLRANGTRGRLRGVLERLLEERMPADAHLRVSGRCFVAVTRLARGVAVNGEAQAAAPSRALEALLISEFNSRRDLIDALLASCARRSRVVTAVASLTPLRR